MTPSERAQLRRLGESLIALAEGRTARDAQPDQDLCIAAAQREISRRKVRSEALSDHLIDEAGWHILLELYVTGKWVEVAHLGCRTHAPSLTHLPGLEALIKKGLVIPKGDDRQRLRLSDTGRSMVENTMRRYNDIDAEAEPERFSHPLQAGAGDAISEVAQQLGVSPQTIARHRLNMIGLED